MATKISLITAVQERLDNTTLTVRRDGKVLGRVVQDSAHKWLVLPPEVPRKEYPTLQAAVEAMCAADACQS